MEYSDSTPAVSVVIPTYGRVGKLRECLNSVTAQTLRAIEIIVVDDASPDDPSAELAPLIAADPRIRLICQERNQGPSAARNRGVREARGRFVALIDSDDQWVSTKLERQHDAALAAADPDRVFCVTQTLRKTATGSVVRPERPLAPGRRPEEYVYVDGNLTQTSSFFVARQVALAVPFREALRQYEDQLFFIEVCLSGAEYIFVPEPLSIYDDAATDGRLSFDRSLRQAHAYLEVIRPIFSAKGRLAFEARYMARYMMRTDRRTCLRIYVQALRAGALRPWYAASFLVRLLGYGDRYERDGAAATR